jgi:SAM-dependent methyltransferase/uncharacterized protein YbaR (Trm112 family)
MSEELDPSLLAFLVCPRDKLPLAQAAGHVGCPNGHHYAVVEGIPILLLSESKQTHIEGDRSLAVAEQGEAAQLPQFNTGPGEVDPFVRNSIGATNGAFYQHLVGKLADYPIPELRLPEGNGKVFVEIGCSWGRWCIAAARKGYRPIGIDPSLKGVRAARRVARQLGVNAWYLVADGRYLPFADATVDQVFSYSVFQHLAKEDVRLGLAEIHRVLRPGSQCQIQMPNTFGIRCLYHQARRGFRQARDFEVRYWTPRELTSTFETALGPSQVLVDGYFSLNAQVSDLRFLPRRYRALIHTSEALRKMSEVFPPLAYVADSLYVNTTRRS